MMALPQAGHFVLFPAAWSGAFNFFLHDGQAMLMGMRLINSCSMLVKLLPTLTSVGFRPKWPTFSRNRLARICPTIRASRPPAEEGEDGYVRFLG